MSDRTLLDLHPDLQPLCQQLLDAALAIDIKVIITQTYRSSQEQDADYAQGRSAQGHIITNARGGESPHNCTLEDGTPAAKGFDIAIYGPDGKTLDWDASHPSWQKVIAIGEGLGLASGSAWHTLKDNPHFELPNWNTETITT